MVERIKEMQLTEFSEFRWVLHFMLSWLFLTEQFYSKWPKMAAVLFKNFRFSSGFPRQCRGIPRFLSSGIRHNFHIELLT